MSENIPIPKILQDREGPSIKERFSTKTHEFREVVSERRKKISRDMARVLLDITFDKRSVEIDDYDEDNPDKYDQDLAFASYEPNLRETYRREKIEKAKRLGSLAMVVTGLDIIPELRDDRRRAKQRQKQRESNYRARNGTVKSRMRDRYVARMEK